jgi:hypothetical protein
MGLVVFGNNIPYILLMHIDKKEASTEKASFLSIFKGIIICLQYPKQEKDG